MKQVICLLALLGSPALLPGFVPAALAQTSGTQTRELIWLQIEAQPSLEVARERARAYAALFPDVSGFATNGWYAIALGPFTDRGAAEARLRQLKADGLVPGDSFIAFDRNYQAAYWPDGNAPRPAAAAPVATPEPAPEPSPAPAAAPEAAPDTGLAADARVRQRLVLADGDVREPAWSPYRTQR